MGGYYHRDGYSTHKISSLPSCAIYYITLLQALGKFNPGISVKYAIGEKVVHHVAAMLVDNKDMWTASRDDDHNEKYVPNLLRDFQRGCRLGSVYFLRLGFNSTPQVLLVASGMALGERNASINHRGKHPGETDANKWPR